MLKFDKNPKYAYVTRWAFGMIALLVCITVLVLRLADVLSFLSGVLTLLSPLVYGAVIAYIASPLVNLCEKKVFFFIKRQKAFSRSRRGLSIALTFSAIFALIATVLLMVIPQITQNYGGLVQSLVGFFNTVADAVNDALRSLEERFDIAIDFELSFSSLSEFLASMGVGGGDLGSLPITLLEITVQVFLSVFFAVCFLARRESICLSLKKCLAACLPRRAYAFTIRALRHTHRTFGRFLVGTIFVSVLIGIAVFVVLGFIHLLTGEMPYYALIAVIVAVTNVIPYFGPFLGAIPSAIIILTDSLPMAILFCFIILILQQIDGNFITPRVLGQAVGLDSLFIIVAIAVMGGLLGVLGMFIGVPVFAVFYTAVKFFIERRLRKKKLPLKTEAYEQVFSGHDTFGSFPKEAEATEAEEVTDSEEA